MKKRKRLKGQNCLFTTMIKLSKKEEKERKIYFEIFMKNRGNYINDNISDEDLKEEKYPFKLKCNLIKQILTKYSLLDDAIVNKIKKCLPHGFDSDYSIEDNEYKALIKEFPEVNENGK
jgi:hypothetical protein